MSNRILILTAMIALASQCTSAATFDFQWSETYGHEADAYDVTTDSARNIIVTGYAADNLDFGGGVVLPTDARGIYLAKLDPLGNHIWSQRFGDSSAQFGMAVVTDDAGNIYLLTGGLGAVDFGGGQVAGGGGRDIALAKFSPDGTHIWSRGYGDGDSQNAYDLGVDGAGNIALAGEFAGTIDLGGGPLTSAGDMDIFVARLDPAGNHVWSRSFGDSSAQMCKGLALAPDGSVTIVGLIADGVDFGDGYLAAQGDIDIAVARFDTSGNLLWNRLFGTTGWETCSRIAITAGGECYLVGDMFLPLSFGGPDVSGRSFLAKLDAAGNHVWSNGYPGTWGLESGIARGPNGEVYVAGHTTSGFDVGGDVFPGAGGQDAVAACIRSDGQHLWSRLYGGADDQYLWSVATDADGNAIFFGDFAGTFDVEGMTLATQSNLAPFLVKFSASLSSVLIPSPGQSAMIQAHPNPFNPRVTISYSIPRRAAVTVTIHDISGRLMHILTENLHEPGPHTALWDGRDLSGRAVASGTYLVRLEGDGLRESRKIELVR